MWVGRGELVEKAQSATAMAGKTRQDGCGSSLEIDGDIPGSIVSSEIS